MGKIKRQKISKALKQNPLKRNDLPNLQHCDDFAETSPVEVILEQLQNPNIEEKINGLQALAVLATSQDKISEIFKRQIIEISANLLCDKDESVRHASAGALRNVSILSSDFCDYLVERDVLTPLTHLLKEYIQDKQWIPSFDSSQGCQMDLYSDIFLQSINLLWNLCESNDEALDIFNQSKIVYELFRYLNYELFGLPIAISVAQCFLVVSENNPKSWIPINENIDQLVGLLKTSESNEVLYLGILSAGILSNVPALFAAHYQSILLILSQSLQKDHIQILAETLRIQQVNSDCSLIEMVMDDNDTCENNSNNHCHQVSLSNSEKAVQNAIHALDSMRLAAEIITNMCAIDEEEYDDLSSTSGDECADLENFDDIVVKETLPSDIVAMIKSENIVSKLWHKTQGILGYNVEVIESAYPILINKLQNVRLCCFISLQNLCNTMTLEDLGGPNTMYDIWLTLGQQILKKQNDASLTESMTSLMRSTLQLLKSEKQLFTTVTENDIKLILENIEECKETEILANWLRILGILGCLLEEPLVEIILLFISNTCLKQEQDAWTISEAVDAIMDIFADNDWERIVFALNIASRIKQIEKLFKSKVRQQKKELKLRCVAVQTVQTNLRRFVQHIEQISTKNI